MAELDTVYQRTNDDLQEHINEALLQLGNLKNKIDNVSNVADGLEVDSFDGPAEVDMEFPESPRASEEEKEELDTSFPATPPPVVTPPIDNSRVETSGLAINIPDAPTVTSPGTWAGPVRPNKFDGFSQFFQGTPDTPDDVVSRANEQVRKWVDTFFPAIKNCFVDVPESWICDVISGVRPLGGSERAIEIAWRTARANEQATLRSLMRDMDAEYTARGFTLPPGALVAAGQTARERMGMAVAAVNREAALKDIDVQVQLLQLAVETAARLKQGLAGVMVDFYRTVAGLADNSQQYSIEKARIMASAEAQFMDGLLRYQQINQSYHESLAQTSLSYDQTRIEAHNATVRANEVMAQLMRASEELKFRAAELNSETSVRAAEIAARMGQVRADIYRSVVQGRGTEIASKLDVERIAFDIYAKEVEAKATAISSAVELEKLKAAVFTAVNDAKVKVAAVKADTSAGTGLAGVARAFGDIASAAANASGTLIAQIEGF